MADERKVDVLRLGHTDYSEAEARMRELQQQRLQGAIADTILICSHPEMVTIGPAARRDQGRSDQPGRLQGGQDAARAQGGVGLCRCRQAGGHGRGRSGGGRQGLRHRGGLARRVRDGRRRPGREDAELALVH